MSSVWPLFATRAAASCDAPIFKPTSRFGALRGLAVRLSVAFGSRGLRRNEISFLSADCFGLRSFGSLGGFAGFSGFGFRLKEISFFSNDCFGFFGSGGSSAAGTGGWMPSAGFGGAAAASSASASCTHTQSSSATGRSSTGSAFGLGFRPNEISFFQNGTGFSPEAASGGRFRPTRSESLISFFQSMP